MSLAEQIDVVCACLGDSRLSCADLLKLLKESGHGDRERGVAAAVVAGRIVGSVVVEGGKAVLYYEKGVQ